ncbi:MAG: transporter related protein [Parcubacteria group bacterium]|nr:transporter related protein [Parcubacteria group bacterium]
MKPIIEIKNLGKKYNITHQRGGYIALRDVLMNVLKSPLSFLKSKAKQVAGMETKEEFWALKDINLEVKKGEIIGIIGSNGAGKSTLLKILCQITPPTTGEIKIHGRVGSLLEVGTGFHPELTGRENIFLNGAILGMTRSEMAKKFDQIVEFAGIEKFLDTPVKYYSSGMYVRLAFSVAAHLDPDILIIDEVLAVGDAEFQKKCMGKMEEVTKQEGRTILFVSHNMNAILNLCRKCVLLERGSITFMGDTREAINRYLKTGKLAAPVSEVRPNQHLRGTRESLIKTVSISNNLSEYKNTFSINEPISLEIDYYTKKAERELSFWLLFANQNGEIIINSIQKDSGILINPIVGEHRIKIDIEKIGLLPGSYSVTAGIFAHNSLDDFEFVDWVDLCQFFDITNHFFNGKSFDGRMGIITKGAEWKIIK